MLTQKMYTPAGTAPKCVLSSMEATPGTNITLTIRRINGHVMSSYEDYILVYLKATLQSFRFDHALSGQ